MVLQNYALYPHMTVAENMAFALKLRQHIGTTFIYVNHDQTEAKTLGIRPEHVSFVPEAGSHCLTGSMDVSEMMGIHLHVNAGGCDVVLCVPTAELTSERKGGFAYGDQVHFTFCGDLIHLFDPETEKNLLPLAVYLHVR